MQSRARSAIEIVTNVGVKFVTATLLWIAVRPYSLHMPAAAVTLVFTINSLVFGYIIRRIYVWLEKREAAKNTYLIDGVPYVVKWYGKVEGIYNRSEKHEQ